MIGILTRWVTALSIIFSCLACSDNSRSPTDRIIDGPFNINTQWQEFSFKTPLMPAPYLQYIQLLSCNGELDIYETGKNRNSHFFLSDRFRRLSDKKIIEPEVKVTIDNNIYRFAMFMVSHYSNGDLKGCRAIGYRITNLKDDFGYFLPREAEIRSILIKSNVEFQIDKLYWLAPNYWKAPDENWEDVLPSDIIDLSGLSN